MSNYSDKSKPILVINSYENNILNEIEIKNNLSFDEKALYAPWLSDFYDSLPSNDKILKKTVYLFCLGVDLLDTKEFKERLVTEKPLTFKELKSLIFNEE